MATDKLRISELPLAGALTGNETTPILQGGVTKRTLLSTIKAWLKTYFDTLYQIVGLPAITKDPSGFGNPELVIITGNGDRTITLTGTVAAYWQGVVIPTLISGYTSAAHGTDTAQTYFLSYNGTTIAWSTSVWEFSDVQICIARYDADNAVWYYERECHGLMPWSTHYHFHDTVGTVKDSGGTIPAASYTLNSTTAANRRPNIDLTVISDEDLNSSLPAWTGAAYTQFRLGTAGVDINTLAAADIISLSTNNPYYNTFSTPNWSQTLMPANSVATVWIMARQVAADATSQKYRYQFIQPQWITQATGATAGAITTAVEAEKLRQSSELNLGTLANVEYVFIAKVIVVFTSANWSLREVTLLTGSKFSQIGSPAGNFLSTVAVDGTTITGNGLVASPLAVSGNLAKLDSNNVFTGTNEFQSDVSLSGTVAAAFTDKRLVLDASDIIGTIDALKQTTVASDTTPNPTGDGRENEYYLTALAGAAAFEAPSGTPVNGNTLLIRIKDNGTARALTYNAIYYAFSETLPTTTIVNKTMYLLFIYDSTASKWNLMAVKNEL